MALGDNLPGPGLIKYGTFRFLDAFTETLALDIRPMYDTGNRTVTHTTWDLTLRTYLEGNPSDTVVQNAIAELTRAGQVFRYTGHGASALRIHIDKVKDVLWGPLPKMLSLKPVGGQRICELTWQVQVAIPTCKDAVYGFSPLEYSFRLEFSVAKNTYQTRTYTSILRIPNNRNAPLGRGMLDTPDDYLEKITPKLIEGFQRISQVRGIDESKTKLTLTVVDEEMHPNALPLRVTVGQASHQLQNVIGSYGNLWTGTVEADYEVADSINIPEAVQAFVNIAKGRMDIAKAKMKAGDGLHPDIKKGIKPDPVEALLTGFTVNEPNIHGPGGLRGKFSLSYRLTSAVGFGAILDNGGLWRQEGAWDLWIASVAGIMGPRGHAVLGFKASEDKLVDLCQKAQPVVPEAPPPRAAGNIDVAPLPRAKGIADIMTQLFPYPKPATSWIDLKLFTYLEEDHGSIAVKSLPLNPLRYTNPSGLWEIMKENPPRGNAVGGEMFPPAYDYTSGQSANDPMTGRPAAQRDTVVQQRTTPTGYLYVRGTAFRAGYPIPCPVVVGVNGRPVQNCNRIGHGEGFVQGIVGYCQVPVFAASWNLRYHATDALLDAGEFPVPPNLSLA